MARVGGLLLAAGAGRRMGAPKALLGDDRPWVARAADVLRSGGCEPVRVVVGAAADEVVAVLAAGGTDVEVVRAEDWESGMGASFRAGIAASQQDDACALLVHLVDLPDVGADVVRRLLDHAAPDVVARADYGEGPGHPVLIGRDHWASAAGAAHGDIGAREVTTGPGVLRVDCTDLATGRDVDEAVVGRA